MADQHPTTDAGEGFTLAGVPAELALQLGAAHGDSLRRAELAAAADTMRAAYLAAKAYPTNPLEGLIRLADSLGVDLTSTDVPAAPPAEDDERTHLADVCAAARLAGLIPGTGRFAQAILDAGYARNPAACERCPQCGQEDVDGVRWPDMVDECVADVCPVRDGARCARNGGTR